VGSGRLLDTGQFRYDVDWTFGDLVSLDVRGQQYDVSVDTVEAAVDETVNEEFSAYVEVDA
jgi:hypothetical protein